MKLIVQSDGTVRSLYGEELDLLKIGLTTITRGSHVEPTPSGHWMADLAPVDGPQLGPFTNRSEALMAEREWLEANWLTQAR